jgi:pentatricopeptide repeat protein
MRREEAYATVIHSLAVDKKTKEACELFESLDSDRFGDGVSPGVACYSARMLAHVEAHEWDEALACHSQRKEAGLPWTPSCFQDFLLASFRVGKKQKALEAVEEALGSGMRMDCGCCVLSMQILLGDVLKSKSIGQARQKLRELGEQNGDLKNASLNLSRSLRTAEVEEHREPTKGLKHHEILSRRDRAWTNAVQYVVELTQAVEKHEDSN